jgi:hypothetical protein
VFEKILDMKHLILVWLMNLTDSTRQLPGGVSAILKCRVVFLRNVHISNKVFIFLILSLNCAEHIGKYICFLELMFIVKIDVVSFQIEVLECTLISGCVSRIGNCRVVRHIG